MTCSKEHGGKCGNGHPLVCSSLKPSQFGDFEIRELWFPRIHRPGPIVWVCVFLQKLFESPLKWDTRQPKSTRGSTCSGVHISHLPPRDQKYKVITFWHQKAKCKLNVRLEHPEIILLCSNKQVIYRSSIELRLATHDVHFADGHQNPMGPLYIT